MSNSKRYIDADDFYKSQVKRCGYSKPLVGTCTADNMALSQALYAQPTADVVEVVRCKDCQFAKFNTSADVYKCDRRGYFVETVAECDFCSKGKRKEQT